LPGIHNKDALIPKTSMEYKGLAFGMPDLLFLLRKVLYSTSFWLASHWMSVRSYLF